MGLLKEEQNLHIAQNKIYSFSVQNEDGTDRIEVVRTSNWEGLKLWEQLNMFKVLLLQESWSENLIKCIRIVDEGDLEYLSSEVTSILEEYQR
jgi:hypothetical protein